ncbi:uncharacterized protein IL334_004346 [Kwoniella shivajii]|uniref:Uncharacterized protein n=1 Tax=Kwoniella shivajii TaxID=564305 RepID=A0ABZ1D022_9TREE|nr:hypothetical protein IL334_004346 [Kwoniella shivajii]
MTTEHQMTQIITCILNSRAKFIKVVEYLLEETRCSEIRFKQVHTPTLALLTLKDSSSGKRKRSISHFQGIPLSILSIPTSPCHDMNTQSTRKIIARRKIIGLDTCFKRLTFGNPPIVKQQVDQMDNDQESGSNSGSARSSATFTSSITASEDEEDQDEHHEVEEDWDESDDEDDIIFNFNQ